jgi:predicted RecA/RadA family phage recombinase
MKDDGQWIIMMGFLVSLGIFFLAIIISQSTLVGQTTAEGVLEFPKNDIQDLRHGVLQLEKVYHDQAYCNANPTNLAGEILDIRHIYLARKNAIVNVTIPCDYTKCTGSCKELIIHYNNGVTMYDENPITINL